VLTACISVGLLVTCAWNEGYCCLIFLVGLSTRILFLARIKHLQAKHLTSFASFSAAVAFVDGTWNQIIKREYKAAVAYTFDVKQNCLMVFFVVGHKGSGPRQNLYFDMLPNTSPNS